MTDEERVALRWWLDRSGCQCPGDVDHGGGDARVSLPCLAEAALLEVEAATAPRPPTKKHSLRVARLRPTDVVTPDEDTRTWTTEGVTRS